LVWVCCLQVEELAGELDNVSTTARETYSNSLQRIRDIQSLQVDLGTRVSNLSTQANASASLAAGYYAVRTELSRGVLSF